jgi:hypothetical protein
MRASHIGLITAAAGMLYACTLDFDQYRGPGTGGSGGSTTTGGNGPGGSGPTTGGTGGTTTTGGTGGTGGSATGGAAPDCPADQPQDNDMCNQVDLQCFYAGNTQHCECWGGEFNCEECPADQPMDGDGCQGSDNARCFYDDTQCHCGGQGPDDWNCATCPASKPDDGDNCFGYRGLHCTYGQTECSCSQGDWNC